MVDILSEKWWTSCRRNGGHVNNVGVGKIVDCSSEIWWNNIINVVAVKKIGGLSDSILLNIRS